jgi:hypothetical protein
MSFGEFYIRTGQDTTRNLPKVNLSKTEVQINLESVKSLTSSPLQTLNETDILLPRQVIEKPKKQFYFRSKSLENANILYDSTIHLRPSADLILLQIAVHPKGLMLPSQPFKTHSNDWFTYAFLLTLIILVFVKNTTKKYFTLLFQSITSFLASSRMYREQNISLMQGSAVMELFYLLVMVLFGFQVSQSLGISLPLPDLLIFLICFTVLFLFFQAKNLLLKLLGIFSESLTDTREYMFNVQNHYKVLSILLWPLVALIAWLPFQSQHVFMATGLVLTALFYLFYLIRGTRILIKKQYSIFYLFLYLCTLEFLPLLLLFKVVQTR